MGEQDRRGGHRALPGKEQPVQHRQSRWNLNRVASESAKRRYKPWPEECSHGGIQASIVIRPGDETEVLGEDLSRLVRVSENRSLSLGNSHLQDPFDRHRAVPGRACQSWSDISKACTPRKAGRTDHDQSRWSDKNHRASEIDRDSSRRAESQGVLSRPFTCD